VETLIEHKKEKALNDNAKCLILLVSRAGIEPTTYGLKVASEEKTGDEDK
jgi:hypothetical protein